MEQSNTGKILGIGAITLIIGLIVGGLIGYPIGMNNANDVDNTSSDTSMKMDDTMDMTKGGVEVGGAMMVRDKDIVDNAANAKNVSTLVAAVKAAGLVDTLKSTGPFTVFGPNNDAFDALPAGTLDNLLKPENKDQLAGILTYHVVPGTYTEASLRAMAGKGESLTSVQGGMLMPVIKDGNVMIKDAKGNMAMIETPDVLSSNGVTFVIDAVLMQ